VIPGRRVAEEVGDVDQQRVEEPLELLGMDLQVIEIVAEALALDGFPSGVESGARGSARAGCGRTTGGDVRLSGRGQRCVTRRTAAR